jgi:enamine deaminase RidA (YjgF/YER057c/UK114 family)
MARRLISSGFGLEERAAYSRAVVDGDWVFVSGTTGYDPKLGDFPPDPADQARQIFVNIEKALAEAGAALADVVRVRYLTVDRTTFEECLDVFAEKFAAIRPAATLMICALADPRMKVEVEVTAKKRQEG